MASSDSCPQSTGDATSEERFLTQARKFIEEHGVAAINEFIGERIDAWKYEKLTIAIAGVCGSGKSAFVNAIRGLNDYDEIEGVAAVDVTEETTESQYYQYPNNPNFVLCDLPGFGGELHPTFQEFCEKIKLEKFDAFLILSNHKFTDNDLQLAKKVSTELCKPFFFVRTHAESSCESDRKSKGKKFDKEGTLEKIRDDCFKKLKDLVTSEQDIFLIDNYDRDHYDFDRLIDAIATVLKDRRRECFILSLANVTRDSLKRKVEFLRGRIWMVASLSAAGAVVPFLGVSIAVDFNLIRREVNLYKTKLGLPGEDSDEFRNMNPETRENVAKYCLTGIWQLATLCASFSAESAVEEYARFIPILGSTIAGGLSFFFMHQFLHKCLRELEIAALETLE